MTDTIDKLAMYVSGGLLLLATVGTGLIETVTGKPYVPAAQTNDAGQVIAQPTVDPSIRTGMVVAAMLVLLLYAGYKLATPTEGATDATTQTASTTD
jgi:hypothetical protein